MADYGDAPSGVVDAEADMQQLSGKLIAVAEGAS